MIYLGDNWPDSYRGKLYTLNFHGRRINVDRLERHGSGYIGKHDADLFICPDPFFRGIDLTYGPDGGVFILDWSDTGECHESTGVHRTSGRIYKITYGTPSKPNPSDLSKLTNEELFRLVSRRNAWFPRMARRLLTERARASKAVANELADFISRQIPGLSKNPVARANALMMLHSVLPHSTGRGPASTEPSEELRALIALQHLDRSPIDTADGRIRATNNLGDLSKLLSDEKSQLVRLTLASALFRLPPKDRAALASSLVSNQEGAHDHNLPALVWQALSALSLDASDHLISVLRRCQWPLTRRLIVRRLASATKDSTESLDAILQLAIEKDAAFRADILAGLSEGFTGWRKAPKPAQWDHLVSLITTDSPEAQTLVRELSVLFGDGRALDEVRRLALDSKADLAARKSALQTLIEANPDDLRTICEKLLGVRFLNTIAARGLARFDDPQLAAKLARSYRNFHPTERPAVLETLVSRPTFARALLDQIAEGKIPREDLGAFQARQIANLGDPTLAARLTEVWGEIRESTADKRELIATIKSQLTPATFANASRPAGRALYNQLCATCHTLYGHGGRIGPDLTGSGRNNLDYLLENIIDPGAVVTADFRLQIVTLRDGRTLNGMITASTERTLTLQTLTEPVTVEKNEIASRQELPQSLMPEGLLQTLTPAQIRDLIAYLMSPTQAPLP